MLLRTLGYVSEALAKYHCITGLAELPTVKFEATIGVGEVKHAGDA